MRRIVAWLVLVHSSIPAQSPESVRPEGALELAGLLHHDLALNRAHDVELQGSFAYVAGKGGSLAIVDVSDPRAPRLASFLHGLEALEDAETVLPMGDILLVGARDLLAVDIRDPLKPAILKRVSVRPQVDLINGMGLHGSHVLAVNKRGYVAVFDISNPRDPVFAGARNTRELDGLSSPHDIAVFGDYAAVVDTARNRPSNVTIFRIADSKTHALLPAGQWVKEGAVLNAPDQELPGANRVAVWEGYGAAGAFDPDRIGIFSLTPPREAKLIGALPVCDIDATGMAIAGRVLFVAGGECVEAIDVSDPAAPVSLAQYRGGSLFPTRRFMLQGKPRFDNAHDLVYRDGHLYVTAQNDNRLGILKVLNRRIIELARSQEDKR